MSPPEAQPLSKYQRPSKLPSVPENTTISNPASSKAETSLPSPGLFSDTEDEYEHTTNRRKKQSTEKDFSEQPQHAKEILQNEKVLKSGYLLKKGEKRKTWKKRWFVLRSTQLAYYKDEREYKLLRLLELDDIHNVEEVKLKHHENVFAIVTPSRTYYVRTDNKQDKELWIREINQAINELKDEEDPIDDEQPLTVSNAGVVPIDIPQQRRPSIGLSSLSSTFAPVLSSSPTQQQQGVDASHNGNLKLNIPSGHSYTSNKSTPISPLTPSSPSGASYVRDISDAYASSEEEDLFEDTPQQAKQIPDNSSDGNQVLLQGYLLKLGRNKSWRKRYFVLRTNRLSYYRHEKDSKEHRAFSLTTILDALEIDPISNSKPYCLKIVMPKRNLILCAPTENDLQVWLEALNLTARRAKRQSLVLSSAAGAMPFSQGHGDLKTSPGIADNALLPTRPEGGAATVHG
ncbi:uncharacterized protein VTP21DRAFT_3025 [Calcarisporiella thermophila]|uniref:uncharacterized protein n=1 Tax=Calcarisporiella thermophila TaxID=911321 RepID=UPI0037437B06